MLPGQSQNRVQDINRSLSKVVSEGDSVGKHAAKPALPGAVNPTHHIVNSFVVASSWLVDTGCPT